MKAETATVLFSLSAAGATSRKAPDWLHLIPAGTFTGADGRGPFHVTDAAELIAASLPKGGKLPIDENHAIDYMGPKGGASPARAWIVELQSRDDGIWGRVEWTAEGRRLIEDRAYGFISPALMADQGKPRRVVQLVRASLVNDPNLTGLASLHAAGKGLAMNDDEAWAALRTELGFAVDADGAAIVQAVKDLRKSLNSADPARFVPIETFQATLAELHRVSSGISLHAAERAVDQALEEGLILPFMKPWRSSFARRTSPPSTVSCRPRGRHRRLSSKAS